MATILHMDTDAVREFSRWMTQAIEEMKSQVDQTAGSVQSMSWISPAHDQFIVEYEQARAALQRLLEEGRAINQQVTNEVSEWEMAAVNVAGNVASGTDGSGEPIIFPVSTPIPIPTPTPGPAPAPAPDAPTTGITDVPEEIVRKMDGLLKPIDWVSDSAAATKKFNLMLEEIGRTLNKLTGQRGHIKMMGEFDSFIRGATDGVGFLNHILDLRVMSKHFSGQLTNSEAASVAIKALLPIPVLNNRLAQFLVQNMVDPGGHWHGLVRPTY